MTIQNGFFVGLILVVAISATASSESRKVLKPGETFKDCDECPEMVVILPGRFRMGDLSGGGSLNEKPVHDVSIEYSFAVGKYEVTFEEWDACSAARSCDGYHPPDRGWGRGRRPVMNVSWDDAQSYVRWLRGKTGHEYRLLSELEWEYVARAGTSTEYSFGDFINYNDANFRTPSTKRVGSYRANEFGVHDMHGNVWEWVEDCWHDSYSGSPKDGSSWTSDGSCSKRVLRGGSWNDIIWFLRAAIRFRLNTDNRSSYEGFRIARTLSR